MSHAANKSNQEAIASFEEAGLSSTPTCGVEIVDFHVWPVMLSRGAGGGLAPRALGLSTRLLVCINIVGGGKGRISNPGWAYRVTVNWPVACYRPPRLLKVVCT